MRLTYNLHLNIAYLRISKEKGTVRTLAVSDDLNVDLAEDGSVYGIELLNANEQLRDLPGGMLTFENEDTGEVVEVALP